MSKATLGSYDIPPSLLKNAPPDESKESSVKIRFEPKEPLIVFADNDRLYQVIFNLIKYALKFTDRGEVLVKAEQGSINENREAL